MIIPDINLLVYAYDAASPAHTKTAAWWQALVTGSESVGLPSVVAIGFVRLVTHARVFENPMAVAEATGHVRSWLQQPAVRVLEPGPRHIDQVLVLLETIGTAGNLTTDAQIAALALQHSAIVHTADADFLRFPGVRWFNPLS